MGRPGAGGEAFGIAQGDADPRIPVYVLTGTDNAAARTLLGALARRAGVVCLATQPETWRGLAVRADAVAADVPMARMVGGGLGVDATGGHLGALYQLHLRFLGLLRPRLDYAAVVIEIGSRADCGAVVADFQSDTRLDLAFRIAGVIHARGGASARGCPSAVEEYRIGAADTVVALCCGDLAAVRRAVGAINPLAAVASAEGFDPGRSGPWRTRPGRFSAEAARRMCRETGAVALEGRRPGDVIVGGNLHNPRDTNRPTGVTTRSLRLALPGQIDLMAFMDAVHRLGQRHGRELLRLFAVLDVPHADRAVAVEVIDGVLLNPAFSNAEVRSGSDIAVIARDLEVRQTAELLGACRRDVSRFARAV